jgi:tetratricopeptide (TPR) repeat protein
VADSQRIEDLRRRILKDPASIAFAQLAEEHRRAGQFEEAVRVSSAGLAQHPAYLSARITLGRALLEMGRYDESAAEFEYVLKAAPDNLTAVRELADIRQRQGVAAARTENANPQPVTTPLPPDVEPAIAAEPPASTVDPVVAELEAWLAVLAEERDQRASRV